MHSNVLANATLANAAAAFVASRYDSAMFEDIKQAWRRQRLQELLDAHFDGNKAAMGRALGLMNGAFIRQMLTGMRPVSEKTIQAIEALSPKFAGWFQPPPPTTPPEVVTAAAKRTVETVAQQFEGDPAAAAGVLGKFMSRLDGLPLRTAAAAITYLIEHPDRFFEVQQQLEQIQAQMKSDVDKATTPSPSYESADVFKAPVRSK